MTGMITDEQLIEQYLRIKAHVTTRTEAFEAEIKPYKDGMTTIEGAFLARLVERGADNSKTPAGTAYKSTIMTPKVVKRDVFMQWCFDNWATIGADMMNVTAVKAPVKQFLDDGGDPDTIGLGVSYYTNINVRRS